MHTFAARAAAAVVAAVAGAASFEHIASVAIGAGERQWVGYALPLAIDGLIVVGVAALLEDRRGGRVPRMSARFAVLIGVVATLAANVASAEPTWTARLVAIAAPVAFLVSVEVLTRTGRLREEVVLQQTENLPSAAKAAAEHDGSGKLPEASTATPRRRPAGGKRSAAERVQVARLRSPEATQAEVAKRTRLSPRTVARYWRDAEPANGHATDPDSSPDGRRHDGVPVLATVAPDQS